MRKHIISTSQIILFVVFVSAALITSLFVFHLAHQSETKSIVINNPQGEQHGTIFPVPRDISSFELVTANKKFGLTNFLEHWTLLFFGFTHCSSVCPTTLDMLNKVYLQLKPQYPTLQVVLISVDPERDTPSELNDYVHSFNADFIGVTGKTNVLRKLQSQFGIFSAREENANADQSYQIQHTASILLINPQGKWAGLFPYGLSPKEFVDAFNQSMGSIPAKQ